MNTTVIVVALIVLSIFVLPFYFVSRAKSPEPGDKPDQPEKPATPAHTRGKHHHAH